MADQLLHELCHGVLHLGRSALHRQLGPLLYQRHSLFLGELRLQFNVLDDKDGEEART
jgi:hypothetical protein